MIFKRMTAAFGKLDRETLETRAVIARGCVVEQ
mgnify:CR=1 FL=1